MNTNQTNTLEYLEEEEAPHDPQQKQRLLDAMAFAVEGLKRCRIRKLTRDAHARQYRAHPETFKAKAKAFRESARGRSFYNEYERNRRKGNPYYHFLNWIRGDINRSLRRQHAAKHGRTETLVGCAFEHLRRHIESQFVNGMSWETRSSFDVDHIVPISVFDLRDQDEQLCAFNWRNLRPLERLSNRKKGAAIPFLLPNWLPPHIAARIESRRK